MKAAVIFMKKFLSGILIAIMAFNIMLASVGAAALDVRDLSAAEEIASDLKELGLFKGVSDTDFDLDRAPSRTEAIVMLIRILGKENDALNGRYSHPFTDVADWANKYVGYAYSTGLTNGISATEFGASDANAATFLTFVLRALGYSDTNGADFTWDNPFDLAKSIGILTDDVNTAAFWRADVAIVAYNALGVNLKGSSQTLAQKLIGDGVFTAEKYAEVFEIETQTPTDNTDNGSDTPAPETELSAKQIFEKCSPAVFYITTYDVSGEPFKLGSGFFIESDGTAITNLHVLNDAIKATATLADGTVCDIEGVIKVDGENDFAVIKVKGDNFPTLELGDSNAITTGDKIYTIGNPKGLSNTISDGIVSNTGRAEYFNWIQITAPISSGSSGGALINEYGKVIGVTTASMVESQNLNFAVPMAMIMESENLLERLEVKDYLTVEQHTVLDNFLECIEIAGTYSDVVAEEDPANNSVDTAPYVSNGNLVVGYIDAASGSQDIALVRCNAPGKVRAFAMSPLTAKADSLSESEYKKESEKITKEIDLVFEKVDDPSVTVRAVTSQLDSGSVVMLIDEFDVPEAGVYAIKVSSDSLYDDKFDITNLGDLATASMYDYMVYYYYMPDYTSLPISESALAELVLEMLSEMMEESEEE